MASRMDKYRSNPATSIHSRFTKNKHLYEELYTNKVFTEFTNVEPDNVVDLSNIANEKSFNRREQFQKNKFLNPEESTSRRNLSSNSWKEEKEEDKRNKNYNINDILEDAKKNRTDEDELEKKRRLKSVEYSILSDLSQEKLKDSHDKKKTLSKDEEENLEELIHTITSNSLRKKIDDELLSDLLPSEESETIISKKLLDDLEDMTSGEIEQVENNREEIDHSFYTKSMDLSEEDFEFEEEDHSFLEGKKMGMISKILICLLVIGVIGIIIYVIYRFI